MTGRFYVILRQEIKLDKDGKVLHLNNNVLTGQRIFTAWGKARAYQQTILSSVLKDKVPEIEGIHEMGKGGQEKTTFDGIKVKHSDGTETRVRMTIEQILVDD